MMTGEQYLASLRDEPAGVPRRRAHRRRHDGCRDSVRAHGSSPAATTASTTRIPAARNPAFTVPRTVAELRDRCELLVGFDVTLSLSAVAMALLTSVSTLSESDAGAGERIHAWFDDCAVRDVRFAELITDAKGDRSLSPSKQDDPDLYVRVVDRDRNGVVIRGAKFHTTAGPLVHELVVLPTKRMRSGEEDYAIACAVPADAAGVIQIVSSHHARHGHAATSRCAAAVALPDSMVVFDDVYVPNERVFLDGDVARSATVAHALGLWERLEWRCPHGPPGRSAGRARADDRRGQRHRGIAHIKDKIAEIVVYATMTRACLEAALSNVDVQARWACWCRASCTPMPASCYAASGYAAMVRNLHDIAGGTVVTAPSFADYDNPETAPFVQKYLRGASGVTAEHRLALFHAIHNMTADEWGGREAVSWLQSGGGLFAQRTVTRNHYDMAGAVQLASALAGVDGG